MEHTMVESRIPFPHANAIFVTLVEFVCGAGLVIGLLTPLCALGLAGVMIVAVTTNRVRSIEAKGLLAWLDDFLYLPEVLYVMILVWLAFSGPGRYSIDGLIAWRAGVAGVERAP
jgi:putative oxidoreductase